MKNYVVVDFDPQKIQNKEEWDKFLLGLENSTGKKWELLGSSIKNESFHSIERYIHYFILAIKLFLRRKKIKRLVSNQQFYGIIFSFLCSIFKVKKTTTNIIVSFIYNSKHGLIGKLYKVFIKISVNSIYIDKLIVHSESEIGYYSNLLGIEKNKLYFCPLGITDDSKDYDIKEVNSPEESYVLAVGNSNRDFKFLENALIGENYEVRIFSDRVKPHINQNIVVSKAVPVSEYYKQLANCFCSIIPIDNPNFSSGQLILLQSYAFNKPVIITPSNVNNEYIGEGNAIVIHKSKNELRSAINMLRDKTIYQLQTKKANDFFTVNFSMIVMGEKIGNIFKS